MNLFDSWYVIPMAFALDLLLGDPLWLFHPIRWMGSAIAFFEPLFRRLFPGRTFLAGGFFAVFLILLAFGLTWAAVGILAAISPVLGTAAQVVLVYFCISSKSLMEAAMAVDTALRESGLPAGREKVSWIVGREVSELSEGGVVRASVETVAENLVDGVISPLFFAAIGGAPLAMAYKMVNTLDSMVGYKNERYLEFGRVAARIDDVANYLPARLSVPVIAAATQILCGRGRAALAAAIGEGRNHSSPNAGFPEAAFAGAMEIRLGGPNRYYGKVVEKPWICGAFGDAAARHIEAACQLMLLSSLTWMGLVTLCRLAVGN